MPRCSCAETKPGCRLKNSASAAHALIRCSASSGLTLNLLTRMTGPSLVANCADSGNVSSISTNFIISSFLSPADLLKIRTARPHPAAKRLPHRQVVEYVRQQCAAAQDLGQVHLHERSDPT